LICSPLYLTLACLSQTLPAPVPDVQFCTSGTVLAAAVQGDGKIIIGGYFTIVNGVARDNIARLNTDGSLDTTWNPGANGAVRQIVLNGTDSFILGDFTAVDGQNRPGLAKISITGPGAVDEIWNPSNLGDLHAMAVSGTNVFVGGLAFLAKISTTGTGAPDPAWGAAAQPDINIFALAVQGTNLYVAGNFSQIGGLSKQSLARINTSGSGSVDSSWDMGISGPFGAPVYSLVISGSSLFVGGSFNSIGGLPRTNIAKINVACSGCVDQQWNPIAIGNVTGTSQDGVEAGSVTSLALDSTGLYISGTFTTVSGAARTNIARVSTTAGGTADSGWVPNTSGGWVTALACGSGSVFAGGGFSTVNGRVTLSLAKLTSSNGAPDVSFSAQVGNPGRVMSVARQADGKVIVGGDFYLANGLPRQNLARFNLDGSLDDSWLASADGSVTSIAIQDTNIFVAGIFGQVGGQSRRFLARLSSTATNAADSAWNPNPLFPVDTFSVAGTNLFIASSPGGVGRVFRISTTGSGQIDPGWNPGQFVSFNPNAPQQLLHSLLATGDSLYVGGDFDAINGNPSQSSKAGLVKLSSDGAAAIDPNWGQTFNSYVQALAIDGFNLYAGGRFGFARLNATGASDASWIPDVASGYVSALALSGTNLFAGGWISTASGLSNATLVRLSTVGSGTIDPTWNPDPHRADNPGPSVLGLAVANTGLFVVGDFDTIGGEARQGFAFLAVANAPLMSEGPNSLVIITRNQADGPEITGFRIKNVQGGTLYVNGSLVPLNSNDYITVQQAEAGLRFIGLDAYRSVTVVSALSPNPGDTGNIEATLVLKSDPVSSMLAFDSPSGLTLLGVQGRSYQIEFTDNLGTPNWSAFRIVQPAGNSVLVPGTHSSISPQGFYRARLLSSSSTAAN
jgi:hypothetical protein